MSRDRLGGLILLLAKWCAVTPISTVEEGVEAILILAYRKKSMVIPAYNGLRPSRANAQAYDHRARERLRALSVRLTGNSPSLRT